MSKSKKNLPRRSAQWTARVLPSEGSGKRAGKQGHGLSRTIAVIGGVLLAVVIGIVVYQSADRDNQTNLRELVVRDVQSMGMLLAEKAKNVGDDTKSLSASVADQTTDNSAISTFHSNAPRLLENFPPSSALVLARVDSSTTPATLAFVETLGTGIFTSSIDQQWLAKIAPSIATQPANILHGGVLMDAFPPNMGAAENGHLIWYASSPATGDKDPKWTVLSFVSIDSIVDTALPNHLALSYDVIVTHKQADGTQRLASWNPASFRQNPEIPGFKEMEGKPTQQYLLKIRNESLSVLFNPTMTWITKHESPLPRILFILSLTTISLASLLMFILSRRTAMVETRVQKRTEQLAESERQLEVRNRTLNSILDRSPDLMMLQNREGKFRYSNPRTLNVLSADLNGRTPWEIAKTVTGHSRDVLLQIAEGFKHISEGATTNRFDAVTVAAGNTEETFLDIVQVPVRDDEGQIVRVLTVGRNITEQRTQLSRFKQAQRRIATLLQDTATAIIEWDTEGHVVGWNPAAEDVFGYTVEEARGMSIDQLIPTSPSPELSCSIGNPLADANTDVTHAWQNKTKDGLIVACEWQNTTVNDNQGNAAGTTSFIFDVTRRTLAESTLQEREVVLRALANSSVGFMQGSDWEPEARALLGSLLECVSIDRASLIRQRPDSDTPALETVSVWQRINDEPVSIDISCYEEIASENEALVSQQWLDKLRSGVEISGSADDFTESEQSQLEKSGTLGLLIIPLFKHDWLWGFLRFDHGLGKQPWSPDQIDALRVVGAVLSTAITKKELDHKQSLLERRLLHAQKRESLGILASGVANNFNELINNVLGNASLARTMSETDSSIDNCLATIETDGLRASELCREMLLYSGHNEGTIGLASINIILLEAIAQLKHTISDKIEILTDFASGLPVVEGDAEQLKQAIYNVLLNAAEAMETGTGLIRIQTGIAVAPASTGTSAHRLSDDDQTRVFIRITDTGRGIDNRSLEHIFDPFFSTKSQGRGLGLTLVQTAIEAHEGSVKITSELGHGSIVNISLPSRNQVDMKRNTARIRPLLQLSGTVLYAESDDVQRSEGVAILRKFGLRVDAVTDGQQALDLISQQPDRYLLVILDLRMPVMDGLTALTQILKLHEHQRIILTSSRSFTSETHRLVDEGIAVTIEKPLDEAQLSGAIQQLLDRYPVQ